MSEYHYHLFADYYQFYLQDEEADGDLSDSWTPEAVKQRLALAPGTIGIGTAQNNRVPVTVQVLDVPPSDDLSEWDQVNECSIEVASGSLVIAGCSDYFPDAARISVVPGWYRVRIYYGLTENEKYKLALWPAPETGGERYNE